MAGQRSSIFTDEWSGWDTSYILPLVTHDDDGKTSHGDVARRQQGIRSLLENGAAIVLLGSPVVGHSVTYRGCEEYSLSTSGQEFTRFRRRLRGGTQSGPLRKWSARSCGLQDGLSLQGGRVLTNEGVIQYATIIPCDMTICQIFELPSSWWSALL